MTVKRRGPTKADMEDTHAQATGGGGGWGWVTSTWEQGYVNKKLEIYSTHTDNNPNEMLTGEM